MLGNLSPMTNTNTNTNDFDPAEHTVAEVTEHLTANPDDATRVIEAEQAGKARKGVIEHSGVTPTDRLGRTVENGVDYLGRTVE